MSWASDDLAQVIVGGDREFAGFAQGILREWNADTFENVVDVRGGLLTNLPVKDRIGALTYQTGDVLMLARWKPRSGRGIATYWIDGAAEFPAAGKAAASIAFMESTLAKRIAKKILAEGIFSDSVAGQESTSSTTYTDLPTPGPTVPNVEVSEAGVAIVFTNAGILGGNNSLLNSQGGDMSFEVSGATSIGPDLIDPRSSRFGVATGDMGDIGTPSTVNRAASMAVVELNPGVHTFTAKYKAVGSSGAEGVFNQRSLVVIAL